jgi:hypothetical protein
MLAGMTTTRQHLLGWVHAHGLAALAALFRDEALALAGPKGQHQCCPSPKSAEFPTGQHIGCEVPAS